MSNINMRDYYRETVNLCKALLTFTIDSYLQGFMIVYGAENGIATDANIPELRQTITDIYSDIPALGDHLVKSLRLWQENGATLKDLCEICGVNPKKYNYIPSRMDFVEVMKKYQLDFADAGKRPISWQDNAPLTLGILTTDDITKIHVGKQDIA